MSLYLLEACLFAILKPRPPGAQRKVEWILRPKWLAYIYGVLTSGDQQLLFAACKRFLVRAASEYFGTIDRQHIRFQQKIFSVYKKLISLKADPVTYTAFPHGLINMGSRRGPDATAVSVTKTRLHERRNGSFMKK